MTSYGKGNSIMILSKDGEQTIMDGEGHTTFIKAEKFGTAAITIKEGVEDFHMQDFYSIRLCGRPFKDCRTLLKWYFARGVQQ